MNTGTVYHPESLGQITKPPIESPQLSPRSHERGGQERQVHEPTPQAKQPLLLNEGEHLPQIGLLHLLQAS